jgi:hypothetical protein
VPTDVERVALLKALVRVGQKPDGLLRIAA